MTDWAIRAHEFSNCNCSYEWNLSQNGVIR